MVSGIISGVFDCGAESMSLDFTSRFFWNTFLFYSSFKILLGNRNTVLYRKHKINNLSKQRGKSGNTVINNQENRGILNEEENEKSN